jgi:hypothetical protein
LPYFEDFSQSWQHKNNCYQHPKHDADTIEYHIGQLFYE